MKELIFTFPFIQQFYLVFQFAKKKIISFAHNVFSLLLFYVCVLTSSQIYGLLFFNDCHYI